MDAAAERPLTLAPAKVAAAAAYAALGAFLVVTRVVGLDRGYASDELMTVRNFVRAGPREILTGAYIPNNHELFSLLGWATSSLVGESAVALRLWSVVPFLLGVTLVTAWLHARLGALSGVLFLFFCAFSPLLLDITRQARGYGLAFLAMSVLVVAALEAERTGRTSLVALACAAGVVGTWTLPNFGVAFVATASALLVSPKLRRATILSLGPSILAIVLWYAPNLDDVARSSQQEYAAPIEPAWILTAPIDQTLLPALRWIDEALLDPDLFSLLATVALALVLGSSPLLRRRVPALVLTAGVVASVLVVWVTRVSVAPRFFSFLLVPLLVLLASGAAAVLARFAASGRPIVRAVLAVTVIGVVAVESAPHVGPIVRLPREAVREAAALIAASTPATTPVYAHVPYPNDLAYYLGRPVETPVTADDIRLECKRHDAFVLVTQPWVIEPLWPGCRLPRDTRHVTLEQYARGQRIDVWIVPAIPSAVRGVARIGR